MSEKSFIAKNFKKFPDQFDITWSSPSNIALVKYWGKNKNRLGSYIKVHLKDICSNLKALWQGNLAGGTDADPAGGTAWASDVAWP